MAGDPDGVRPLWKIGAHVGPMGVGIEAEIPYYPGLLGEIVKAEIVDPLTLLFQKVLHAADFVGQPPGDRTGRSRSFDEIPVDELRRRLLGGPKVPRQPEALRVTGIFSTAVLLSSGWWERNRQGTNPVGRNEIQRWTYAGFEEWGPSWDFTSDEDVQDEQFFLGQLGEGDEANSVLVVAVGERARRIRAGIVGRMREQNAAALAVEITGLLCHRKHLARHNGQLRAIANRWHNDFNYCLLLDSPTHRITPVAEVPDFYSAYLWQCWWAKKDVPAGALPSLNDCYLVWEHTDLTKRDAILYNLDSLEHKAEFLRQKYGPLELLQKSGPVVPGSPLLRSGEFQHLFGAISRM